MLTDNDAYKYVIPYKVPCVITQCWTNGTVTLQCVPTKNRHNIRRIKPYTSDTNVEDINLKTMYDYVNILSPFIYFCLCVEVFNKVYNWMRTDILRLINIGCAREVFHDDFNFFHTGCAFLV